MKKYSWDDDEASTLLVAFVVFALMLWLVAK